MVLHRFYCEFLLTLHILVKAIFRATKERFQGVERERSNKSANFRCEYGGEKQSRRESEWWNRGRRDESERIYIDSVRKVHRYILDSKVFSSRINGFSCVNRV